MRHTPKETEGFQDEPSQNVPLWHTDCFEMKAFKTQQIQRKKTKTIFHPKLPKRI